MPSCAEVPILDEWEDCVRKGIQCKICAKSNMRIHRLGNMGAAKSTFELYTNIDTRHLSQLAIASYSVVIYSLLFCYNSFK